MSSQDEWDIKLRSMLQNMEHKKQPETFRIDLNADFGTGPHFRNLSLGFNGLATNDRMQPFSFGNTPPKIINENTKSNLFNF